MAHVSKYKLTRKAEEQLIDNLIAVFTHVKNPQLMTAFLMALLTSTERLMLGKRLAIIILLEEGLPESEIADKLHTTRITVAKTKYYYYSEGQGFKVAITALKELQRLDAFKKMLISLARYSVRAAGGRVTSKIFD